MSTRPHPPLLARTIVLLVAALACRGGAGTGGEAQAAGKRYTVRGEVVTVPAQPGGELVVRHEAIPSFADKSGAVVGMASMVMPFPVGANVSLAGLAPGDKVEFVFSVDWAQGRYAIESLTKLPPETALKLGKAPPAEAMDSPAPASSHR